MGWGFVNCRTTPGGAPAVATPPPPLTQGEFACSSFAPDNSRLVNHADLLNQLAIAFVLVGLLDVLLGHLLGTLRVIVGVHGFLILA